jgi:hypothetical protein
MPFLPSTSTSAECVWDSWTAGICSRLGKASTIQLALSAPNSVFSCVMVARSAVPRRRSSDALPTCGRLSEGGLLLKESTEFRRSKGFELG